MALNWNVLLDDDTLNIPNDPWPDLTQTPPDSSTEMPKSSSTLTPGSEPGSIDIFNSFLNATSGGPYFDDAFLTPNDYFLGDFEVLQPLGDTIASGESTSESSPEPSSGALAFSASQNLGSSTSKPSAQSPQMSLLSKPITTKRNTFPNLQYESMFPNSLDVGFVEDLTFPDGPIAPSKSSKTSIASIDDRDKTSTGTTAKRAHSSKPDILSACWTSPLCPNHNENGPPPNPSNCGGGCAPFLFANEDTLPISAMQSLSHEAEEVVLEEGIVEIKSSRKRSESESSGEPSGRRFSVKTNNETPIKTKSESEDSPQAPAEDKSKSRRRLPHNQVERKYRESLNTQLESLRRVVPSLQQNQRALDGDDIEDLPTPSKPSKAVILASATAYIKQMEKDKKSITDENQLLKARIKALQALVKCEDCSLMQYVMDLKIKQPN
jgi:hypothetical protein